MAKKSAKKRKPNVYLQSYEVSKTGRAPVTSHSVSARKKRTQNRHLLRSEIYVNTLGKELKRMGIIAGGVTVVLITLAVVLNVI